MDKWTVWPDKTITASGVISERFLTLGISTFKTACEYVHNLPYGYNSDRDDLMILFTEKMGTCTTKHAVVATLALEQKLPVEKNIGIYAMTEEIVAGCDDILEAYGLAYVPMIHCFLTDGRYRVDLTEGNNNGKKCAIDQFLFTESVVPNISEKDEYLLYRNELSEHIMTRKEMQGHTTSEVLKAREKGLALLKRNIESL